MGRIHLVGAAQAGLGGERRRGLRDLAIAVVAGAVIWGVDAATGRHLAAGVNALAARLAGWYEERREPVVNCEPSTPRAYTSLAGAVLQVPQCWEVETTSLFDREVHRFHDPEARAGTLSVSVEPIGSDEDRDGYGEEFARMAALPGARIDGRKAAEGGAAEGGSPRPAPWKPSVPDSLAERILHGQKDASARAVGKAQSPGGADAAGAGAAPPAPFRIVEAGGLLGAAPGEGGSARLPDGSYAQRTWTWLLLGDRAAVRVVYAVRADWSENVCVGKEFQRADAVVRSVTPAP